MSNRTKTWVGRCAGLEAELAAAKGQGGDWDGYGHDRRTMWRSSWIQPRPRRKRVGRAGGSGAGVAAPTQVTIFVVELEHVSA